jgi:hypothetical protein
MKFLEWLRWATRDWPFGYYWHLERKRNADSLKADATVEAADRLRVGHGEGGVK